MMGEPEERSKEERVPQLQGTASELERPVSGLGVAALVLGGIGLVFFWVPLFGQLLSILAVIFGWVGLRQVKARTRRGLGAALAGMILGIIGLLVLVSLLIIGPMVAT